MYNHLRRRYHIRAYQFNKYFSYSVRKQAWLTLRMTDHAFSTTWSPRSRAAIASIASVARTLAHQLHVGPRCTRRLLHKESGTLWTKWAWAIDAHLIECKISNLSEPNYLKFECKRVSRRLQSKVPIWYLDYMFRIWATRIPTLHIL